MTGRSGAVETTVVTAPAGALPAAPAPLGGREPGAPGPAERDSPAPTGSSGSSEIGAPHDPAPQSR